MTNNNKNLNISKFEMLSNKLEIFIITFNRASLLLNTLEQLKNSPFSFCKITILDNCSTDNTLAIAKSKKAEFINLCVITNKLNIGGDANVIRAIELSNGIYTWVLCDDDNYDFSDCSDVIDAILNERYDLIHMGAHSEYWKYGAIAATPKELIAMGYPYFKYCSFLPCNLFRTQRFYNSIISAYNNIHNLYPHLPFLIDFLTNNDLIYVAKNRIVTAVIGAQVYSGKEILEKWFNCSKLLSDRKYRLLFFLLQSIVKNKNNSINRSIIAYGVNLIYNKDFKYTFRIFLVSNLMQSALLFLAILISPVWYIKRRLQRRSLDK